MESPHDHAVVLARRDSLVGAAQEPSRGRGGGDVLQRIATSVADDWYPVVLDGHRLYMLAEDPDVRLVLEPLDDGERMVHVLAYGERVTRVALRYEFATAPHDRTLARLDRRCYPFDEFMIAERPTTSGLRRTRRQRGGA